MRLARLSILNFVDDLILCFLLDLSRRSAVKDRLDCMEGIVYTPTSHLPSCFIQID